MHKINHNNFQKNVFEMIGNTLIKSMMLDRQQHISVY